MLTEHASLEREQLFKLTGKDPSVDLEEERRVVRILGELQQERLIDYKKGYYCIMS
jgi:hypothetical protein